jgi:Sulfotransferase family
VCILAAAMPAPATARTAAPDLEGDQDPVFVVSSGRCGSTLVSNVLRLHPEVCSISEFLVFLMPRDLFPAGELTAAEFWSLLAEPRLTWDSMYRHDIAIGEMLYRPGPGTRFTADTGIPPVLITALPHLEPDDPEALYDDLREFVSTLPPAPVSAMYRRVFAWLRDRGGRKLWVERSGSSLAFVQGLIETFPRARFVHLYRDGRDTALSMSRQNAFRLTAIRELVGRHLPENPFDEGYQGEVPAAARPFHVATFDRDAFLAYDVPVENFGRSWSLEVAAGMAMLMTVEADRVLHLRYENVVANPDGELTNLARFLGVDPEPDGWLERSRAIIRPTPSRWMSLPEPGRSRLERSCRLGMSMLYGAAEAPVMNAAGRD